MAWDDRLKEAAYTSPGGTRIVFQYENVSRLIDKKTAAFDFPDADGTFIQDLGHTGRRYPLRLFFWGSDYDLAAAAFEEILLESGTGILEHPMYGSVNVVPFGEIKRRDDLKTAGNQAIIEVTFWETIDLVYPAAQGDPSAAVISAVDAYNTAMAQQFANQTSLDSAGEQASFKNRYLAVLAGARTILQPIADTQDDVRNRFNDINDSINNGINTLVGQPLSLVSQTLIMIQEPGRALALITAKLEAYRNLAESFTAGDDAVATPGLDATPSNDFHTNDVYAMGAVSGSVVSGVNGSFKTRPEAIETAEEIIDQFEQVVAWRDLNFDSLSEIDTGEAYQQLQDAVALVAGFLVELSFSLKPERRLILDRNRTIIDLVGELYGTIDSELDFFIKSNNLTGSEILELPAGREIVYYV